MKNSFKVSYLSLNDLEFKKKIDLAFNILHNCCLCPRHCGVNRLKGQIGECNSGKEVYISSYGPHFGEEKELVGTNGSGTIFFTFCNLKCLFCQNYDISNIGKGYQVSIEELSKIMISLQNRGCHNINLVTPTHFIPQIIKSLYLAKKEGLEIPLVYNCGGYESVQSIKILKDIIDIYMPDIKFGDNINASKYIGVKDYFDRAREAIKEMYNQVGNLKVNNLGIAERGLIIRHLVMPNNIAKTDKVLEFISKEISNKEFFDKPP